VVERIGTIGFSTSLLAEIGKEFQKSLNRAAGGPFPVDAITGPLFQTGRDRCDGDPIVTRSRKPNPIETFDANIADAESLLSYSSALGNQRARRLTAGRVALSGSRDWGLPQDLDAHVREAERTIIPGMRFVVGATMGLTGYLYRRFLLWS
jgi:hypothetical protein